MDFNAYTLLGDFTFASILIFAAKFLREKVKPLQEFFVPVSLLAGFVGMILGPNGFGLNIIPFSSQFGSYSGLLIIVVFVTIGLRGFSFGGKGVGENAENLGRFYIQRNIGWAFQYAVPALFAYFLLKTVWPDLHNAFGMLIPAGFQGGHGTAAALGDTLGKLGWNDAKDLGMTSATVGILVGIFGGIIIIKLATKKGYTSFIKDFGRLPDELRTGIIPEGKRSVMGEETVSPIALDPLGYHLLIVLIPTGLGYWLTTWIAKKFGVNIASFSVGILVAVVFQLLLKVGGMKKQVDLRIINRIGSCATDYLVFFGVASIKIPVVIKYAGPFVLLMLFGIAWTVFHCVFLAPRLIKRDWFEHGIFVYGYSTGVFAIGFSLLRIVDPENRSSTLDETAILTPIESIIEIFALALIPSLLTAGNWQAGLLPVLLYLLVLIIIPFVVKWWVKPPFRATEHPELEQAKN